MTDPTWVFGYGSLIWRQDFPYIDARPGYIDGWARRFWQGSHDHRGVQSDPGRVVTLVDAPGERCYGRAFLIEPDVFEHLDDREINGYERNRIEIPTPRWSTYDAKAQGVEPSGIVPATIQERAWSSPIWYTPDPGLVTKAVSYPGLRDYLPE
jgi:cation transport regulator ChaC